MTEYAEVRGKLLAAAALMPDALYGFRATPAIRSFGEELNHAADVNLRLCALASGDGSQQSATEPHPTDKDGIVERLARSLDRCDIAFGDMTDQTALEPTFGRYIRGSHLTAMLGHSWHEYGKLTVLLRLNGIAPPSGD